jgi:DNA-binding MarR family transcriptional regulator
MIGNDGVFGATQALDGRLSLHKVVVQVPGSATVVDADHLKLVGTELPLTQEFLAEMMGVRRTSVTGVATQLQKEGLISYRRGKINILSIDLVQKRACECHKTVRDLYVEMFGIDGPSDRSSIEQTRLDEG